MSVNVNIDGRSCSCEKGEFLLDVAKRNGINIPTLCHHPGLAGQGCCRVCIAEVETRGLRRVVTACVFPLEQDCSVYTDSEKIRRQRSLILALLRARAPESLEIARMCEAYGAPDHGRLTVLKEEKCALCGLCVKACESLGTGALSTVNRGVEKKVSTPYEEPSADCIGCGSCAGVCPTGKIEMMQDDKTRTIWGREFGLVFCKSCGAVLGTCEEVEYSAKKAAAELAELCEGCKRKAVAKVMASVYGS